MFLRKLVSEIGKYSWNTELPMLTVLLVLQSKPLSFRIMKFGGAYIPVFFFKSSLLSFVDFDCAPSSLCCENNILVVLFCSIFTSEE